ncbi:ash family protein [Salmonella enterica subsp. enterica serovar Kinondoni]|nr:ash family protein [Salmonella enterica subsp. enterica serovar Kinondoni]ELF3919262.1 ash family protein [Salmonella enterica]
MTINGIRGYISCAAAKSVVGIGTPDINRRISRVSGFFVRKAQPHSNYGGACGGVVRLAGRLTGSSNPVRLTTR